MQLGLAIVRGVSMKPTYRDGDVLLVGHGLPVHPGHAYLVQLPPAPEGPRPLAVKRVTRRDGTQPDGSSTWWVERDNPREGIDSWLVGAIPDADIRARVLVRLPRRLARFLRAPSQRV